MSAEEAAEQPQLHAESANKNSTNLLAPSDESQTKLRRPSGTQRTCGKCQDSISGQFVRALDNTWHLDCFTCHDCGKVVASKFFPVPDQPPHQYPLCEKDYFGRLNLLCHACGGALRGSYITALDRKYHIEHFTCSVCPTIFGAADSYYEHDGDVYCHYHYSTKFAQRCNGCKTAILKQFVEIYRQGENQHWHPECYMIHKYWNVRLHHPDQPLKEISAEAGDASEEERKQVREDEERIENKVLWIWRTLSSYEERSASCISDMLLHVSNGAYIEGIRSAKKFIVHIELLFNAADDLDFTMMKHLGKGLAYSREAKLLCKKVVAFFALLAQSQGTGMKRLGVTQELLSLVTGLAHYLKLLIRICLQGSLKLEREIGSEEGLQELLEKIQQLDTRLMSEEKNSPLVNTPDLVHASADNCPVCFEPVEDRCFRHRQRIFHYACMRCQACGKDLTADIDSARWDERDRRLFCRQCYRSEQSGDRFAAVSRLQQYVHLLRVAHARLLANLEKSGALPHTSDDPNLDKFDSSSGHRLPSGETSERPSLNIENRSKSYAGHRPSVDDTQGRYEQALGDIRRLRSTRMDKSVSETKRSRRSQIVGGHRDDVVHEPASETFRDQEKGFRVLRDRNGVSEPMSTLSIANQDSITLDDIPRLVAAEQAKEQRPNATKYAHEGLLQSQQPQTKMMGHRREASGGQELEKLGPEGGRVKRYFSELTALEYFIVRTVAVLAMTPMLDGHFNQEELLGLIEPRKQTFWGKFGKAFQKTDKKGGDRKKGIFGMPLEYLAEQGAESTDCVGPGAVKVPALVQDAISAMRTMDMSIEGVFRKNGNIRRLNETAQTIDAKGTDAVDLNGENPVQVAALLKKFLRELPDPVMTFKLHKLFVTSQKIQDQEKRQRVLHLSCCLLPKAHRETMEVLFCFLNWAASFCVVDEETGSKMDTHNMATVIAPNILFQNSKTETMEDSFLAIEAVYTLLQHNETMSLVPEDLQSVLNDSGLFSASADITTKEILKRYGNINKTPETMTSGGGGDGAGSNGDEMHHASKDSRGSAPVVTRVDENPYQTTKGWQAESSVRAVGGQAGNYQQTPPQPSNGFYGGHAAGSRDSFAPVNGSPHKGARDARGVGLGLGATNLA